MHFLRGTFEQNNGSFDFSNEQYSSYENNSYTITVYGDAWINNKKNDLASILNLYIGQQDNIVNHLGGLYLLFLYDKTTKALHIYQDYYTSPEILYYTVKDNTFYFSNHLQTLLLESDISRSINKAARMQFLKQGFVSGSHTLLNHVYKISPFHKLTVTTETVIQKKLTYHFFIPDIETGKARWTKDINRAISLTIPDCERVSLPISGGYDSNYILYFLNKYTDKKMDLFTVGGTSGIDETESVKKIVDAYGRKRNRLTIRYTSDDMLPNFPDIVWRLGGAVYERGVFLQYKLASALEQADVHTLICGECADQIMHKDFWDCGIENKYPERRGKENLYDFASSIIIKKSGIMLNSFDIKGEYPYTNQQFAGTAISVGTLNSDSKLFHKKICEALLPSHIYKQLHKNGGATFIHSLFPSDQEIQDFLTIIESSSLYKATRNNDGNKDNQNYLNKIHRILKRSTKALTHCTTKISAKLHAQSLRTLTPGYIKTENRLRKSMIYLYLLLFEELFASEQTDFYLKNGVSSLNIHDFINNHIS